ncbi:hypothetical protein MKW92_003956 [Papaver armeniacum]|nr:hypothetical protein MKW92_003956 [Papaver armeniacum]
MCTAQDTGQPCRSDSDICGCFSNDACDELCSGLTTRVGKTSNGQSGGCLSRSYMGNDRGCGCCRAL